MPADMSTAAVPLATSLSGRPKQQAKPRAHHTDLTSKDLRARLCGERQPVVGRQESTRKAGQRRDKHPVTLRMGDRRWETLYTTWRAHLPSCPYVPQLCAAL